MTGTRITFPLTISTPSWAFSPMEDEMQFQKISRRKAMTGAGVKAEGNRASTQFQHDPAKKKPSLLVRLGSRNRV